MSTRLGDWGVTDYTPLMALKPRSQNFLEELGLFTDANTEYLDGSIFEMEREEKGLTGMYNVSRGADRQFAGTESARKEFLQVPFATLDAITKPQEVDGFRQYGTESETADIKLLVERKIEHIQRSHARYLRNAQYRALVDNKVFAVDKEGNEITSLARNFSTVWGKARGTASIDLTDQSTDPYLGLAKVREQVMTHAGDDGDNYEVMVLVNSKQFNQITTHAKVEAAYANYPSTQEPLRRRLSGNRNNRSFDHKGILLVEDISGKIADGKCFGLPLGMDGVFMAAFAPADTVADVGKISKGSYLFMKENWRSVVVESEVAYLAGIVRPELITDITVTVA